jgi:MFS family permease
MISEVTPRGKEFLFFALFSIMGKTSAFIGPIVSSAIIDADSTPDKPGNNSLPFYFLFGLSLISMLLLMFFVDLKKSRIEQDRFLEEERMVRERRASVLQAKGVDVDEDRLRVGNMVKEDVKTD